MDKLTCLRCSHSWLPRIEGRPVSCPSCKSRLWDVPRPEPRVESPEEQNQKRIDHLMSQMTTKYPCDDPICPFCNSTEGTILGGRP